MSDADDEGEGAAQAVAHQAFVPAVPFEDAANEAPAQVGENIPAFVPVIVPPTIEPTVLPLLEKGGETPAEEVGSVSSGGEGKEDEDPVATVVGEEPNAKKETEDEEGEGLER